MSTFWRCGNCGLDNLETASVCEVCEETKTNVTKPTDNKENKDNNDEWQCDNCTLDNKLSDLICTICGHKRPTVTNIAQENENEDWECSKCTFLNTGTSLQCKVCQTINPKNKNNKNSENNKIETTYVWEWKGGNKWHEYPDNISNNIQSAYYNGTLQINLNLSHAKYIIDLTKLLQINTESDKSRKIRCVKYQQSINAMDIMDIDDNKSDKEQQNDNCWDCHKCTFKNLETNKCCQVCQEKRESINICKNGAEHGCLMDLSDEDNNNNNKNNKVIAKRPRTESALLTMFESDKNENIPSPLQLNQPTKKKKRKLSEINNSDNDDSESPKKKKQKRIPIASKYSDKYSGSGLNKELIDALWELSIIERNAGNKFKANAYSKACKALRESGRKIRSGQEAQKELVGVGKKIAAKIEELLTTGHLQKLDKLRADDSVQAINELCQIHGIGPKKARQLVKEHNIFSIEALRNRKDLLNHQQKIGLKYFQYINKRIPRSQCTKIGEIVSDVLREIDAGIIMNICGSYRRGKKDCGDVDILLTHKSEKYVKEKKHSKELLKDIVCGLREKGLLVEDLANGPVKYMGICRYEEVGNDNNNNKLPLSVPDDFTFDIPSFEDDNDIMITLDNPDNRNKNSEEMKCDEDEGKRVYFRRIDLKFINYKFYYANLLYFTGSDKFNIEMRLKAHEKHLILNENGVYKMLDEDDYSKKSKEPVIQPKCEKDIFDAVGMDFVEPKDRSW